MKSSSGRNTAFGRSRGLPAAPAGGPRV